MRSTFKLYLLIFCVSSLILFQGCAAELALLEEGGVAAAISEGAVLSEAEMALIAAEERTIFGEVLTPNTELIQLENVRAVFNGSKYPRLSVTPHFRPGIKNVHWRRLGSRGMCWLCL